METLRKSKSLFSVVVFSFFWVEGCNDPDKKVVPVANEPGRIPEKGSVIRIASKTSLPKKQQEAVENHQKIHPNTKSTGSSTCTISLPLETDEVSRRLLETVQNYDDSSIRQSGEPGAPSETSTSLGNRPSMRSAFDVAALPTRQPGSDHLLGSQETTTDPYTIFITRDPSEASNGGEKSLTRSEQFVQSEAEENSIPVSQSMQSNQVTGRSIAHVLPLNVAHPDKNRFVDELEKTDDIKALFMKQGGLYALPTDVQDSEDDIQINGWQKALGTIVSDYKYEFDSVLTNEELSGFSSATHKEADLDKMLKKLRKIELERRAEVKQELERLFNDRVFESERPYSRSVLAQDVAKIAKVLGEIHEAAIRTRIFEYFYHRGEIIKKAKTTGEMSRELHPELFVKRVIRDSLGLVFTDEGHVLASVLGSEENSDSSVKDRLPRHSSVPCSVSTYGDTERRSLVKTFSYAITGENEGTSESDDTEPDNYGYDSWSNFDGSLDIWSSNTLDFSSSLDDVSPLDKKTKFAARLTKAALKKIDRDRDIEHNRKMEENISCLDTIAGFQKQGDLKELQETLIYEFNISAEIYSSLITDQVRISLENLSLDTNALLAILAEFRKDEKSSRDSVKKAINAVSNKIREDVAYQSMEPRRVTSELAQQLVDARKALFRVHFLEALYSKVGLIGTLDIVKVQNELSAEVFVNTLIKEVSDSGVASTT